MAQERFEKTSAKRALDLYRSFILDESLKDKIANSNRTLVILTIISYFGDCTKTKLKKAIPVASFDTELDVIADTVAMSKPHEIEYTLAFDSSTIKTAE